MLKIPRIPTHQGRLHRRRPDHPRHRRRACSRNGCCSGPPPSLSGAVHRGGRPRRRQRRDGVGNQGRRGVVDRTRQRRCAGRRSPSTASTRSARTPPRTSAPERCSASGCWRWSPRAAARCDPPQVIPATRTSSPYSLTDAVSELTANTAATNTDTLNQSLDTLATTLDQIAPQLGPTFDGLSRLSRSLNSRNESLAELLKTAGDVTGILSERSQQVNTLILNANDLLAVLNERRQAIVSLLANTSAVSRQLTGLVADNEKELAPTLERLNRVNAMLEKNRDNIAKAMPGLAKYELTQGEIVSNGAYYNALIPNISPGADPAAVPGLRVRVPPRRRRRPAAGQRRAARRTAVPRQRHSATRRPAQ